jgi:tetratricopeptide (TPR) repeat protein
LQWSIYTISLNRSAGTLKLIDPDNPIVRLCAEGMRAEGQHHYAEARALFQQAWDEASDDYEACIAAHFLARHQDSPADTLRWNQEALDRADTVARASNEGQDDSRVRDFYPSLYLNMGYSYELLGNHEQARRYYELAGDIANRLPEDRYGNIVRQGIANGRKRLDSATE